MENKKNNNNSSNSLVFGRWQKAQLPAGTSRSDVLPLELPPRPNLVLVKYHDVPMKSLSLSRITSFLLLVLFLLNFRYCSSPSKLWKHRPSIELPFAGLNPEPPASSVKSVDLSARKNDLDLVTLSRSPVFSLGSSRPLANQDQAPNSFSSWGLPRSQTSGRSIHSLGMSSCNITSKPGVSKVLELAQLSGNTSPSYLAV